MIPTDVYSLSIISSFLSVFILYAVAEKTAYQPTGTILIKVADALAVYVLKGKILSFILFLLSTILLIDGMGLASGIFGSMVLWILLASAVLLFAPFQKLKAMHLLVLGMLMPWRARKTENYNIFFNTHTATGIVISLTLFVICFADINPFVEQTLSGISDDDIKEVSVSGQQFTIRLVDLEVA